MEPEQLASIPMQEVNRADADQKIQPNRKQPSAKPCQTRRHKEAVRIHADVIPQIGPPLLLSRLVLLVRSTCTNV